MRLGTILAGIIVNAFDATYLAKENLTYEEKKYLADRMSFVQGDCKTIDFDQH